MRQVSVSAALLLTAPIAALAAAHRSPTLEKRKSDYISSCGSTWMAGDDVTTISGAQGRGYDGAVDAFCEAANGNIVKKDSYLSYATEAWISGGKDPASNGVPGYVYFEVRNKADPDHTIITANCQTFLKAMAREGQDCYGEDNRDTKGGTWQVGSDAVSYHGLANTLYPSQDAVNKIYTGGSISAVQTNAASTLDPFPLDVTKNVKPIACHSHNDYTREVGLYSAVSAGCVSVEADVWVQDNGDLLIGHTSGEAGHTLNSMYVDRIAEILDHTGAGMFPASSGQSLTLLIDFKSDGDSTYDAVSKALEPLRQKGYLSSSASGGFVEKQVTVVASGNAPFDKVTADSNHDIFYDAHIDDLNDDENDTNSHYASAAFTSAVSGSGTLSDSNLQKMRDQISGAHEHGLGVRYYDLPGDNTLKQQMINEKVDRINVDDLAGTAGLKWS